MAAGMAAAARVLLATLGQAWQRLAHAAPATPAWQRVRRVPLGHRGMVLAHLGVAVFVVGVTPVKGHEPGRREPAIVGLVSWPFAGNSTSKPATRGFGVFFLD